MIRLRAGRPANVPLAKRGAKAALKSPQSKRFATSDCVWPARQRLDCGGFSAAFRAGDKG